jgi:3-hydroxybutyryl-CoA dehydrogenase
MALINIGVVGAGMMGSEIALVFALAGHPVCLADMSIERAEKAVLKLRQTLEKGCARGFWTKEKASIALHALTPVSDFSSLENCSLIIEAVFEDETIKGDVWRKINNIASTNAILATNTSSISITAIAAHLGEERRPRFLGTHFFSPVSRMKLVEVIPGIDTSEETVSTVMDICTHIGKTPVRVKDVPGFAVNRLLHAFFIEAVKLLEEEVATPEDIDIACKLGLGHPVGPFELMDLVTNKLTLQVQEVLHENYGSRFMPSPLLRQMVKAGYNGRTVGRGWHRHKATS